MDNTAPPLDTLLQAVAQGDTRALRRLQAATQQRLRSEARQWLRRDDGVEEALQDTWLAVWRHAARFDPAIARPMTWLLSIVRNQAIDRLRRQQREAEVLQPWDDEAAARTECATPANDETLQRLALVQRQLGRLAREQRQAVSLTLYQGLNQSEIAQLCGVRRATVRGWVRGGVERLRELAAA